MRRPNIGRKVLHVLIVVVPLLVLVTVGLQQYSSMLKDRWNSGTQLLDLTSNSDSKPSDGPCGATRECPDDHFSFYLQSGAANVMAPKICIGNKLVLGSLLNNAGVGINVAIVNGKTGDMVKTDHFDMYAGKVDPFIQLLKSIEPGSVVLMASFDEPATKLSEEARNLIAELGSSTVKSLGFRDNWVFVGGKGAVVKSSYEKYLKNDSKNNKYDNWPELIELEGCIPRYLE